MVSATGLERSFGYAVYPVVIAKETLEARSTIARLRLAFTADSRDLLKACSHPTTTGAVSVSASAAKTTVAAIASLCRGLARAPLPL